MPNPSLQYLVNIFARRFCSRYSTSNCRRLIPLGTVEWIDNHLRKHTLVFVDQRLVACADRNGQLDCPGVIGLDTLAIHTELVLRIKLSTIDTRTTTLHTLGFL